MSVARTAILKFGGSSVGNAEAFRHVAGILLASRDAGCATVGVLSAMFGVTNRLLDAAKAATAGDKSTVEKLRASLLDTHVECARNLCSPRGAAEASDYIHATMQKYVDGTCRNLMGKRAADAYDTDMISSVGERWSSRLMSAYLMDRGHDAPLVESDRVIVTDGESGNAKPILDATRVKCEQVLLPVLRRGGLPIVTGFFGASADGKLTTLGRGGSDLSAAVLGYCLDAADVSLYKVEYTTRPDGWMDQWTTGWVGVVHDADPSSTIPTLSYEEARELAHFAKKVLHPETVSPAVEKMIPISVRNTYDPLHPVTVIHSHSAASPAADFSTAAAGSAVSAARSAGGVLNSSLAAARRMAGDNRVDAAIASVHGSAEGRVQTVTKVPLKAYEAKNKPLADLDLSSLHVKREEAAMVVLVGQKIMSVPDLEQRVTAMLRAAGIPVYVPRHVNGSDNNFTVIVPESQRNAATELLHRSVVLPAQRASAAAGVGRSQSASL